MSTQNQSKQELSIQNSLRAHNDLSPQSDLSAIKAVRLSCFLPLLLLVLLPATLSAQITGRVVDSEGNALAGVHISALHNGADTESAADGDFSLTLLEDPVGALAHPAQRSAAPGMSGVRLQRNLKNWTLEIHTRSGVFDLQGRLLRGVESAGDSYGSGAPSALRKALAQADTLVFVKAGYVTKRVEIMEDALDLGDVVMEDAPAGYLCANIVLDANQMCDPRDGKVYRIATIGNQTWMAENLAYLPDVHDVSMRSTTEPRYYVYGYDGTNVTDAKAHMAWTGSETENVYAKYGVLYNWPAAMTATGASAPAASNNANPSIVQGVCPDGWHVPSDAEWAELELLSGMPEYHTTTTGWRHAPVDASGGFRLFAGNYDDATMAYHKIGVDTYIWTSTLQNATEALFRNFYTLERTSINRFYYSVGTGFSVRCVLNSVPAISVSFMPPLPVAGESIVMQAKTNGIFQGVSEPIVTWSVNGGAFTDPGNGYTFSVANAGMHTVIARVEQDGKENYDTLQMTVYSGRFTDPRDDKVYPTTTIGNQTWMAENLNYDAGTGTSCYGKNGRYCDTYGRLYTWDAVMAGDTSSTNYPGKAQGICPEGWHVPSVAEWRELRDFAGGSDSAGSKLKTISGWEYNGNGTNEWAFSALPGGYYYPDRYSQEAGFGGWWSSSETWSYTENTALRAVFFEMDNIYDYLRNYSIDKTHAYSLRCVANTIPTARISRTSAAYPVVGEAIDFTVKVNAIVNDPSAPTVSWSVNGEPFGNAGTNFSYTPAATGMHIVIAKVEQSGLASLDTLHVPVYSGTFTDDRDDKEYPYIVIGNQTWMAKNLAYLPEVHASSPVSTTEARYYVYGYDGTDASAAMATNNYNTYGALYNWAAVMAGEPSNTSNPSTVQGVCPKHWHVPSDAEWSELTEHVLGVVDGATTSNLSLYFKASSGWYDEWNGTDRFAFSAVPGGYLSSASSSYTELGKYGTWWSTSENENDNTRAYIRNMYTADGRVFRNSYGKGAGASLRCVKN
jgi:uncharacterized protein (TIGR02145 family)